MNRFTLEYLARERTHRMNDPRNVMAHYRKDDRNWRLWLFAAARTLSIAPSKWFASTRYRRELKSRGSDSISGCGSAVPITKGHVG